MLIITNGFVSTTNIFIIYLATQEQMSQRILKPGNKVVLTLIDTCIIKNVSQLNLSNMCILDVFYSLPHIQKSDDCIYLSFCLKH